MIGRSDRKARLRQWREEQREAARARLPLADVDMRALFEMLDAELPRAGCLHDRRLTDGWLKDRAHPVDLVHQWLDENGGFCDCEVLANAEPAWRDVIDHG